MAFGEKFLAEASEAAASFRRHHPGLPICLLTEPGSPLDDPNFDQIVEVEPLSTDRVAARVDSTVVPKPQWAFVNKIHLLRRAPFERVLFLDSDTRCCAPLWEVFAALDHSDLVCVHSPKPRTFRPGGPWFHPEINTGMLGLRSGPALDRLFDAWLELFYANYPRGSEPANYSDQSVFSELLSGLDLRVCTFPIEFNCRVSQPCRLAGPVKVLHGRPHDKLAAVDGFLNSVSYPRLYLPRIGMLWWQGPGRGYKFASPEPGGPNPENPAVLRPGVLGDLLASTFADQPLARAGSAKPEPRDE